MDGARGGGGDAGARRARGRLDPEHRALERARLQVLRGRFPQAESGLFDKTHLRFFTRTTAHELAERTGYRIEREQFTRWALPLGPLAGLVPDRVEAAAARLRPELFALQFVLTLRRASR